MEIIELVSESQWLNMLQASAETPVLVFKHSTSCPISAEAHEQWTHYIASDANPDYEYALVHVIESRPVSNLIAQTLNVKHESPQVLCVKGRQVQWHASHWKITGSLLREKLGE